MKKTLLTLFKTWSFDRRKNLKKIVEISAISLLVLIGVVSFIPKNTQSNLLQSNSFYYVNDEVLIQHFQNYNINFNSSELNRFLTKSDFSRLLVNGAKIQIRSTENTPYYDIFNDTNRIYIETLYHYGYIHGTPDNAFSPEYTISNGYFSMLASAVFQFPKENLFLREHYRNITVRDALRNVYLIQKTKGNARPENVHISIEKIKIEHFKTPRYINVKDLYKSGEDFVVKIHFPLNKQLEVRNSLYLRYDSSKGSLKLKLPLISKEKISEERHPYIKEYIEAVFQGSSLYSPILSQTGSGTGIFELSGIEGFKVDDIPKRKKITITETKKNSLRKYAEYVKNKYSKVKPKVSKHTKKNIANTSSVRDLIIKRLLEKYGHLSWGNK